MSEKHRSGFELNFYAKVQKLVNDIEPNLVAELDPKQNHPLRGRLLWFRDELKAAKQENLRVRREALKHALETDYRELESCLVRIGLGFIPTHP